MARPLRIEFEGAWYHVMNRGITRRKVFKTDEQRAYFFSLLKETHDRYNAEWHAYCLMDNHYHLLVRTPEGNLQRIMRHINGLYTQYFNRSEKQDGPLFRGRYKAILVNADAYWLQLSRYIHRNPLEAGLCKRLEQYRWSSYRAYVGKDITPDWLTVDYILSAIGKRKVSARYISYVANGNEEELTDRYNQKKMKAILGDDHFKSIVLKGLKPRVDIPELKAARVKPILTQIVSKTCKFYGIKEQDIWVSTRGKGVKTPARSVAMYLCQQAGDMPLSKIADAFDLASYASAGATIRTIKQRMDDDKRLHKDINTIMLDLTPS